jgi:hypothetical protein
MSLVSEALRNTETRAGVKTTVAGVENSFETLEGAGLLVRRPFAKRGRDPLEEARKRIHTQRRTWRVRQDDETALPADNS